MLCSRRVQEKNSQSTFSKKLETAAARALLEAAQGRSSSSDHQQDDEDSNRSSSATPKPRNKRLFLNLFHLHCSNHAHCLPLDLCGEGLSAREQRSLLFHVISQFQKDPAADFFQSLHLLVSAVLEAQEHVPGSAFVDENDDDDDDDPGKAREIVPDVASAAGLSLLHYAALCVSTYFQAACHKGPKKTSNKSKIIHNHKIPPSLYDTARTLHDCLDQLDDPSWGPEAVAAHKAIVNLCELWWLNDGPHKEHMIAQALPSLVEKVWESGNKAALQRLYSLRTALLVIDFEDAASQPFADLLLRLASSPHCLKVAEGQRLLSYILLEIPALRLPLHRSLRAQIPDHKRTSILQALSEIYFAAWHSAPDESETQERMETDLLQEFVYTVIHGRDTQTVHNLLIVLDKFHQFQPNPRGQQLLQRLYGPILWRGLTAAHVQVRMQSAEVLGRVFPLHNSSSSNSNKTQHQSHPIAQGVAALQQLLQDADPRVRVAGSKAVAIILTTYWDVVLAKDLRVLLNCLVAEHASDATSAAVRAGALDAITILLEAPQSIAVLRDLLPSLGNLIHDKVEKVRLAAVRMLLRIKNVPNIKYYHVVGLDHLNARLEEEGKTNPTNSVASALTGLMVNSYFPVGPNVDPAEQIRRAINFLTEDPGAAKVFYANLFRFRPVEAVAKLCVKLLRCLHSAIERDRERSARSGKRRRVVTGKDDPSNHGTSGEEFPMALTASLAETIEVLWNSIEKYLINDKEWTDFVVGEFSGTTLTNILSYCEDRSDKAQALNHDEEADCVRKDCEIAIAAILRCAGRLPATAVEGYVPHITSLLSSVRRADDERGSCTENVTLHVALLCSWGMTEEVALSLTSSISAGFEKDDLLVALSADHSENRRSGSRNAANSNTMVPALPPTAAIHVLSEILRGCDPNTVSARGALLGCENAVRSIEQVLGTGLKHLESILSGQSLADGSYACFLLQIYESFGRFTLHKEAFVNSSEPIFSEQATTILHWTSEAVVPSLKPKPMAVPFVDPNISFIAVENSFASSFPSSPLPLRRYGKRLNLNRTPERLDEGVSMFGGSPSETELAQSSARVKRTLAISLMRSTCAIYSDWLSVGDSGVSFIAQASTQHWTEIFQSTDQSVDVATALGPDFWRLAVRLTLTGGELNLVKRLLSCLDESTDASGTIQDTVRTAFATLLSSRGALADLVVTKTVGCLLDSAYEFILQQDSNDLDYAWPESLAELWISDGGCIHSALMSVFVNRRASQELARQLVEERFPEHVRDQSTAALALFDLKCLWLVCDGDNNSLPKTFQMVRKLTEVGLNGNRELGRVVEQLLDSLPVD